MSLPFTTNRFLPINVKGSDAITGTYGGVSILNNGKTELKAETTIKRLGVNKNTDPAYSVDVDGNINTTGTYNINGIPLNLGGDKTFDLVTVVDGLDANVGSIVNINGTLNVSSGTTTTIGGYLNVGSSGNLVDNITNIYGEGFKYNDGIGTGLFMVGANNFFIDMDNAIAQTSIGEYDLLTDLFKVETFDFNINDGLDVGVIRMGNDFVFDCVNHTYTDNTLTRNIPNATTTTKTIIATNNVRSTRISVDGKCQIEDLTKVYYTTATNYNIQWGDENTIMVISTVAQNVYLPVIPADETKDGVTFRIVKATNVSVYLMVGDGSALYTEDNTSTTSYQMVGANKYLFVTVGYNSANNRVWRIVQSQAGPATITGTKTFSVLPQCTATPTLPAELITKAYADATYTGGGGGELLTSNNTWSGTNLFNADVTVSSGRFLPVFPLNTTCYRIGTNTLPNSTATTVDSFAWGNNVFQGVAPGTNDSKFVRCIAIGNNAMKFSQFGTNNTACEDNVALGHNAMLNCAYDCNRNVVIGSKACGSSAFQGLKDSVVIGALIGSTTNAYYTNSVIIGSKNLQGSGANDATIIGYGNFLNTTFSYANGATILGSSNLANAVQFNRMICIGSSSLTNLNNNLSVICIGTQSLAGLTTAGYVVGIGSFIGTGNSSLSNTTIIGTNSYTSLNSVCYFGGNDGEGSPTFQDLLPANKNRLLTNQSIAANTTLAFETGEHVNITSSSVTTVTLPSSILARNIGARFTLFKNYTGAVSVTITSGTNGIRLADNSVSNTYTWASAEQYITLVCVATTSPKWAVVNSAGGSTAGLQTQITELDGRVGTLEEQVSFQAGDIETLTQKTTGITYDDTDATTNISTLNTSIETSPQLTIGYGGSFPSETTVNGLLSIAGGQYVNGYEVLSGSSNNLAKPLKEYYALATASNGALTLPVIDTAMYGVQLTFLKTSATNTWTINAGSGNTFRLYKSNSTATATSISLALNNTVLKIVATANVWEVIQTDIFSTPGDWVLATKYCPYKTFPTTISTPTNWDTTPPEEFCKYVLFSNSGTGTTILTLPQISNSAVFEGMEFIFRRTNTTTSATNTSILSVARGGTTDLFYIRNGSTTATSAPALPSSTFYGKIVCVSKSPGRWAYFPS